MTRFGDGLGVDADLLVAADEACAAALAPLGGAAPDLVAVFACGDDPDQLGAVGPRVADRTGAGAVVGCSAGGVIGGGRGVEAEPAVSVLAAVLLGVRLRTFHLDVLRVPDGLTVTGLPERAPDEVAAVLLADPWTFPAEGFVERANDAVPGLPVVGGLATGPRGAGSTRLYVDGRAVGGGAIGVLLGGRIPIRPLVSQGCRPVGPDMVVTRCDGNVVLELAGRPAVDKLREVIAALSPVEATLFARGPQVGIAMDEYAEEHRQGDFLIRPVLGIDETRDGLAVGEVLEVGRTLRFQVRDAEAADADLRALLGAAGGAEGALLFSCNGRGRAMFPSADHDVTVVRELLGVAGVAGFFAGGELGPVGGRNHLHGFTASLLAFP